MIDVLPEGVREASWDARVLGIPSYEINTLTPRIERWISSTNGFFTLKQSSMHSKGKAEQLGFYYCDTLLQPSCDREKYIEYEDDRCSMTTSFDIANILSMVAGTFTHDRFHKDSSIDNVIADTRYVNWLLDLHSEGRLLAFHWKESALAGFWGYTPGGTIVLHALEESFRGKGLAKYFWTVGCRALFDQGFKTITSSVSASNLSVINLYSSLGFSIRNAVDVFHLFR